MNILKKSIDFFKCFKYNFFSIFSRDPEQAGYVPFTLI